MEGAARPATVDMALDDVIRTRRASPRRAPAHRSTGYARDAVRGPARRADAHEQWTHDLYGSAGERRVGRQGSDLYVTVANDGARRTHAHAGADADAGRILVSNLHHEVTRDDLVELFDRVAAVKDVKMHYDRAGRSNGTAHVFFARRRDALLAADRFHHVPLDGYPMQIELVSSASSGSSGSHSARPYASPRPHSQAYAPHHGARRPAPRASFADRRRERSPRRTPAEAHTLDAELDSYMMRQ